jgi:hypothetical protein
MWIGILLALVGVGSVYLLSGITYLALAADNP